MESINEIDNFPNQETIDHNILHHVIKIKNDQFDIYSLNVAQISDLRTMTIFNKINKYLKTSEEAIEYLKKKDLHYLFDEMHKVILKYNLHLDDVEEGSKKLIVDSNIIIDMKEISKTPIQIDYLYLRKYTPKENSKNDLLFRKRFEKCDFRYFDIIFEEENVKSYEKRIQSVLEFLVEKVGDKKCLFLFQEINPILNFYDMVKEFSTLKIVDPTFNNNGKISEKIFTKSMNVLLSTKNFNHRVKKQDNDEIINFFAYEGHEKQKNEYQNIKYYLPKFKLYLYNIHSFLFCNKQIIQAFHSPLIDQIQQQNFVLIIGDLNFKLNEDHYHDFMKMLEENNIECELKSLPFSASIYEGKIFTSLCKKVKTEISDIP